MAGKHGSRSNYADKPVSEDNNGVLHQHRLTFDHMTRTYVPTASERDISGAHSNIPADACGDWSWKPARNKQFPQFEMPAFLGVPAGTAEISAPHEEKGLCLPVSKRIRYGASVDTTLPWRGAKSALFEPSFT